MTKQEAFRQELENTPAHLRRSPASGVTAMSPAPSGSDTPAYARETSDGDIEIKFGTEIFRGNYLIDLEINERRINEHLASQPARYVFWSKMVALARLVMEKTKLDLDKYEAQTYTFVKSQQRANGEKVTEKGVEAFITLDPRRETLQLAYLKAKLQFDHLSSIKEAFSQRKDVLISLAYNLRGELSTTLQVKEREFCEQRLNARTTGAGNGTGNERQF